MPWQRRRSEWELRRGCGSSPGAERESRRAWPWSPSTSEIRCVCVTKAGWLHILNGILRMGLLFPRATLNNRALTPVSLFCSPYLSCSSLCAVTYIDLPPDWARHDPSRIILTLSCFNHLIHVCVCVGEVLKVMHGARCSLTSKPVPYPGHTSCTHMYLSTSTSTSIPHTSITHPHIQFNIHTKNYTYILIHHPHNILTHHHNVMRTMLTDIRWRASVGEVLEGMLRARCALTRNHFPYMNTPPAHTCTYLRPRSHLYHTPLSPTLTYNLHKSPLHLNPPPTIHTTYSHTTTAECGAHHAD